MELQLGKLIRYNDNVKFESTKKMKLIKGTMYHALNFLRLRRYVYIYMTCQWRLKQKLKGPNETSY